MDPDNANQKFLLFVQQLLSIQEELNNKKSELEQAKEEQTHTQAMLKVLQEQVSICGGLKVLAKGMEDSWLHLQNP